MNVMLADAEKRVLYALRVLLEFQPGVDVIDEVTSAGMLADRLIRMRPEILILDPGLPGFQPETGIRQLRAHHPELILIVLSGQEDLRPKALAAGADDFVAKNRPPDELLAAIRRYCPA